VDTITQATIQDMIRAGRIVEARTLLTMQESAFSAEELQGLNLELEQQLARAEAAISQAEELEISGKTEEAKALYESVLLFAVDYPGIQEHIKRLDEALLLTKAVKRRSRRIREFPPAPKEAAAGKRYLTVLGAGLAVGLSVAILLLVLAKPQPSQVPRSEKTTPVGPLAKEKASPEAPVPIAAQQRTVSPALPVAATPAPSLPEKSQDAEAPSPEPAVLSQNELPQSPPAVPTHSENPAAAAVPTPLPTPNHQQQKDVYTVRPGDSLSLIAERLFCNEAAWRKIHQLNRDEIADPSILHPGMVLRLNNIENRCPAEQ
jgi:nucleoid-associated protein YgaU